MGKLNFCGYLISRFYPIREIRENLMHAKKNVFYSTLLLYDKQKLNVQLQVTNELCHSTLFDQTGTTSSVTT